MKVTHYILLSSLTVNVLIGIFWCPLHSIFPCGDGVDTQTAPVSVINTVKFDSTETRLPEVVTSAAQTETKWNYYVSAVESENDLLRKRYRADSITLATLQIQNQQTEVAYKMLHEYVLELTAEDTAALVHKALFETHTETKTFRKDSVAEATVRTVLYQNRIKEQTATFKNLAPTQHITAVNHYSDRFQVYAGAQVDWFTDTKFRSGIPMGGINLAMKFKSNTMVTPSASVGPPLEDANAPTLLFRLQVNQLIRFPKVRAWIEKRKVNKAIKTNIP